MIATTALGSLVFGMAFFRSGGMAMPIGLHLGGNWVQANVLGFAVQQDPPSLWKMALSPEQAAMLFAPELPAKLPHLLAFTLIFVILLQWRREEPLLSRLDFFSLTERKGK